MDVDERQQSFFVQPEEQISIKGNETLAKACNRILLMIEHDENITKGDTFGIIDRRIFAEALWEDGLHRLISSDKKQEFLSIIAKCTEPEVLSRARRELVSRNLITVSSQAIVNGERMRSKIAQAQRQK